ncbi:hypothetical protein [Frankia nepalensis]|uniref:hypothetical protein n=1 Tax=Frankia nepalensis TaxID=1836974 RepID=UPI001EE48B69|nr:hypothetical protein [Frankia nepalensis]
MMRSAGFPVAVLVLAASALLGASPAYAALTISAPGAVDLGTYPLTSTLINGQIASVTVTSTQAGSWTATVTGSPFVTGSGPSQYSIPQGQVRYWSGPVRNATGQLSVVTPGQPSEASAQPLTSQRTAFSATTTSAQPSTVTWNPTLVVNLPGSVVAGKYTAAITHSVA